MPHPFRSNVRRAARLAAALGAALGAALALNGCAWTLITAADATGSVIQAGYAVAANYSSPRFVTGRPVNIASICIENNPMVTSADFVPSLQLVLAQRGVTSDVYSPGTEPVTCEGRLVYNASIEYGKPTFSDDSRAYLSTINLTIFLHNHIAVTARYEVRGLGTDRFSSAAVKLKGLLDSMVVDQTQLGSTFESASRGL
ncbi:hypothetical protein [Paraburkholderia tropica]|uniref:hypothetical protein n=1 Tax=Paraburkholderia tropica TaxID=92647 RepID=UPI002ABDDF51|nr:hypothetical protein [Paraburkholderia tropica]